MAVIVLVRVGKDAGSICTLTTALVAICVGLGHPGVVK